MINADNQKWLDRFKDEKSSLPKKEGKLKIDLVKVGREMTGRVIRFAFDVLETLHLFRGSIAHYYKNKSVLVLSNLNLEFLKTNFEDATSTEFSFLRKQGIIKKANLLQVVEQVAAAHQFYKFITSRELLNKINEPNHWLVQFLIRADRKDFADLLKTIDPSAPGDTLAKFQRIPNIQELITFINKLNELAVGHPRSFNHLEDVIAIAGIDGKNFKDVDYSNLQDVMDLYEVNLNAGRQQLEVTGNVSFLMNRLAKAKEVKGIEIRNQLLEVLKKDLSVQDQIIGNPSSYSQILEAVKQNDFENSLKEAFHKVALSTFLKDVEHKFGAAIAGEIAILLKDEVKFAAGEVDYKSHPKFKVIEEKLRILSAIQQQYNDLPLDDFKEEVNRFAFAFIKSTGKSWFTAAEGMESFSDHLEMVSFFKAGSELRATMLLKNQRPHWKKLYQEAKELLKNNPGVYSREILGQSLTRLIEEKTLTLEETSEMFDFAFPFTDAAESREKAKTRLQTHMLNAFIVNYVEIDLGMPKTQWTEESVARLNEIFKAAKVTDKFPTIQALDEIKAAALKVINAQKKSTARAQSVGAAQAAEAPQAAASPIKPLKPFPLKKGILPLLIKLLPGFVRALFPSNKIDNLNKMIGQIETKWNSNERYQKDSKKVNEWLLALEKRLEEKAELPLPELIFATILKEGSSGSSDFVEHIFSTFPTMVKNSLNEISIAPEGDSMKTIAQGAFQKELGNFFTLLKQVQQKQTIIRETKPTVVVLQENEVPPHEPPANTVYLTHIESMLLQNLTMILGFKLKSKALVMPGASWALGKILKAFVPKMLNFLGEDQRKMAGEVIPSINEIIPLVVPVILGKITSTGLINFFDLIENLIQFVHAKPEAVEQANQKVFESLMANFRTVEKFKPEILAIAKNLQKPVILV